MKILVYRNKHETEYFKYETQEDKLNSTALIFKNNESYYDYPEEDALKALELKESGDLVAINKFVLKRSYEGYEYEELEIENLK